MFKLRFCQVTDFFRVRTHARLPSRLVQSLFIAYISAIINLDSSFSIFVQSSPVPWVASLDTILRILLCFLYYFLQHTFLTHVMSSITSENCLLYIPRLYIFIFFYIIFHSLELSYIPVCVLDTGRRSWNQFQGKTRSFQSAGHGSAHLSVA